ncbi:MAG TPA: DUF1587 domain-containing protein, partial [Myxococcota bacterium]|nr:DUF1587 domain-containing protein [Myxococcota bacterium]
MRVAALVLLSACGAPGDASDDPSRLPSVVQLRRLSVEEYDRTAAALLGIPSRAGQVALPADPLLPFDNVVAVQEPSVILVDGAEEAARALTGALRADPARL